MPIYVYKCSACGHGQDVLQKMSDPLLTVCPQCGQSTYQKQVTAAGFQLKGTGWYVTDFRDNGNKPSDSKPEHHHHATSSGDGAPGDTASGGAPAPGTPAPAPATKGAESAASTPAAPSKSAGTAATSSGAGAPPAAN